MPKFKVSVPDDQGHLLYDEWIEAAGPMQACRKAVSDAGTADVAESEEQLEPMRLTTGDDGLPIGDLRSPGRGWRVTSRSLPRRIVIGRKLRQVKIPHV